MSDKLEELIFRSLKTQDPERLRDGLRQRDELEEIKSKLGPQSKEELWEIFKERLGVELSTVAVCPGHTCQLDMVWEVYSFAVTSVLWVMARGSGKTSLAAWTDGFQAEFYPGWACFTIGATSTQGDRKYEYLLPMVVEGGVIGGKELEHVIRSTQTVTQYKNGSKNEIALGGTPESANGPRTPRLHRDETELMRVDTYKQAANIPAGRKMRDGRYAPAQWLDTSTMKGAEGRVDLAIQKYNQSLEKGQRPSQEVRISCIFESAAQNPACRSAPPEERRATLAKLGRDPDELCQCDSYISDVWPSEDDAASDAEPEPRTLESVCQGRFFRSRGHKEFSDIQGLFNANDRETWNAEQECSQPSTEGAFIRSYNQTRNGIRHYSPDPENGPIYQSTDWGTTDEAWVGWFQILEREVKVRSYKGDGVRTLPIGALVVFSEIYRAGLGNVELGNLAKETEKQWILQYPGWHVEERYYDSANPGAAADWKVFCGMPMISRIKKDFKEELRMVRTRVGQRGGLYVDIINAPWFDKSIRAWKQVNGREKHDFACLPGDVVVETERGGVPIRDVVAGDLVWTRAGLREVLWSGMTKIDDTIIVDHEAGSLECTRDHRVWTQRGWVEAQDLLDTDTMLRWRSSAKKSGTQESSSSLTESSSRGSSKSIPSTTTCTSRAEPMARTPLCIGTFGLTTTVLFQLGMRYIMSTPTRRTTTYPTCNVYRSPITVPWLEATPAIGEKFTSIGSGRLQQKLWAGPKSETPCLKDRESGGKRESSELILVSCVDQSSTPTPHAHQSSARTTARLKAENKVVSIWSRVIACIAGKRSRSTNTRPPSTVPVRVLSMRPGREGVQVYDLHVKDQHEFFAENLLVHNSHAMAGMRYLEHNLHVIGRRMAKLSRSGTSVEAGAGVDSEARAREREAEMLAARGAANPMIRKGDPIVLLGSLPNELHTEDVGEVAGAEDSPLRASRRSMGSESDYLAGFGGRDR